MQLATVFRRLVLAEIAALPTTCTAKTAGTCCRPRSRPHIQGTADWDAVEGGVSQRVIHDCLSTIPHVGSCRCLLQSPKLAALTTYRRLHPTAYYCVDSSYVPTFRAGRRRPKPHRPPGKALKLSVVTDQNGICCAARTDAGNRPDVTLLGLSLEAMLTRIDSVCLYADRGYDSRNNRHICTAAGLADRIFRRKTKTGRRTNAKRVVVEHTFAWLHRFRRLLMFYEQTPATYLAFAFLAMLTSQQQVSGLAAAKMQQTRQFYNNGADGLMLTRPWLQP